MPQPVNEKVHILIVDRFQAVNSASRIANKNQNAVKCASFPDLSQLVQIFQYFGFWQNVPIWKTGARNES